MILKILYAVIFIAVNVINPFFVKEQRNGACPKSLALKMAAATGYVLTGVLGMVIAGNYGTFAKIMMGALLCSWIGDLFLHLWQSKIFYGIGFLGFLSAHFFFIAAFMNVIKAAAPETPFISVWEILFILLFDVFFLVFSAKIGTNLKGILKVPIVIYATVITFMLCKASLMGITLAKAGADYGVLVAVLAIVGAVNFVASDFTIAILMFNEKHKKNYPLKMFNMVTYFIAELLLSGLILFVK